MASLSKAKREILFNKYEGKCAYCGEDLHKGWHADHIEPVLRRTRWKRGKDGRLIWKNGKPVTELVGMNRPENDVIENMNPSCRACNLYKSSYPLEMWRKVIQEQFKKHIQRNMGLRAAKRFGLMTIHEDKPVEFYFERYERELAEKGEPVQDVLAM